MTVREARLWANQAWQGVYTNQRLNLSKLWEGSQRTCQGLKPDPGNLAVRHFRGASRTVRHGETENPPAIERAGPETPHLQRGALDLYPNPKSRSSEAHRQGLPWGDYESPGRNDSKRKCGLETARSEGRASRCRAKATWDAEI